MSPPPSMELASSWAMGSWGGAPASGTAAVRRHLPAATYTNTWSHLQLACSSRRRLTRRTASFSKRHLAVTCCAAPSTEDGDGDRRWLSAASEAIPGDGDVTEPVPVDRIKAGVRVDPSWVVCSFVPLLGDTALKRALELLASLKGHLGDKVEFVIKPTKEGGTDVGINCRWDWKKTKHLRKGCSFYTAHSYQGKTFINNVEAITESIIQNAVLKLILMGCLGPLLHQRLAAKVAHGESRARLTLFLVLLLAMTVSCMLVEEAFKLGCLREVLQLWSPNEANHLWAKGELISDTAQSV